MTAVYVHSIADSDPINIYIYIYNLFVEVLMGCQTGVHSLATEHQSCVNGYNSLLLFG